MDCSHDHPTGTAIPCSQDVDLATPCLTAGHGRNSDGRSGGSTASATYLRETCGQEHVLAVTQTISILFQARSESVSATHRLNRLEDCLMYTTGISSPQSRRCLPVQEYGCVQGENAHLHHAPDYRQQRQYQAGSESVHVDLKRPRTSFSTTFAGSMAKFA